MDEDTLRYLNARFATVETQLAAIDASTKLAADTLKERLHNLNEAKKELKEYQATLVTQTECHNHQAYIEKDLRVFRDFKSAWDAKATQSSVWMTAAIAVGGLIVGLISLFR